MAMTTIRPELPRLALIGFSFLALIIATYFLQGIPSAGATPTNHVIYDDALHWDNWSWNTTASSVTSPKFAGSHSLSVKYNAAWAGLSLHNSGFNTAGFTHLKFAILPSGSTLPNIDVALYNTADVPIKYVKLSAYATAAGGGWYTVSIPLADLGGANTTITRVELEEGAGAAQPIFHIDDLKFVG